MLKRYFENTVLKHPICSMAVIFTILLLIIFTITACWEFFSEIPPFSEISLGLYNKSFWENFLVEAHGFLLDFIIFGILVFGLDQLRVTRETKLKKAQKIKLANEKIEKRNKEEIARMIEELSDYADLDMPEVNRKKLGHIKRLQRYNVKTLDITQLTLNNCNMKSLCFMPNSRLIGLQLQNGHMTEIKFNQVSMRSSFFNNTTLTSCEWYKCNLTNFVIKDSKKAKGTKFISCNLSRSDLRNANLTGSSFTGSNLNEVKFNDAILDRANFIGVENLDLKELSKAKTLNYILLEDDLLILLKEMRSDMKTSEKRLIEKSGH
ncbi:pentapeptide repeat-containing protein [Aliivibrio sp. S3MY1]|uniref:pentapeptide repeat-containing protein n=1 Tax=unclassified Aliivibrio TaxID=2645654 RepID=UPI002379EF60|nr:MULTISPECIES: pentapeptide repeat-containing protein [unclassified Aliivibrio]MDD9197537.1 pentapeptide repeat-containing protein [Aliivibrio sp. S3MY1]MDD9197884.1 pentapeptide repeat-containing protein [Aliivibrio sp. S2MY1]